MLREVGPLTHTTRNSCFVTLHLRCDYILQQQIHLSTAPPSSQLYIRNGGETNDPVDARAVSLAGVLCWRWGAWFVLNPLVSVSDGDTLTTSPRASSSEIRSFSLLFSCIKSCTCTQTLLSLHVRENHFFLKRNSRNSHQIKTRTRFCNERNCFFKFKSFDEASTNFW